MSALCRVARFVTLREESPGSALPCILVATLLMSAWGVVFDLSVSVGYLLLFSAFWRLGGALGSVPGPILLGSWRVMLRPEVRRTLGSMLPRWFTAVLFLSKFETVSLRPCGHPGSAGVSLGGLQPVAGGVRPGDAPVLPLPGPL